MILDEPINGLDPIGIQEIRSMLRHLADDYGMTILISSHILNEIEHIADTIGIMNEGNLIEEISMENLQNKIQKYVLFEVDDLNLTKDLFNQLDLIEDKDYKVENNNIKLFSHIDSRGDINRFLIESGVGVNNVTLVKENLEEYFTHLIGGDLNA